jgi:putative ABC transport system permease protein
MFGYYLRLALRSLRRNPVLTTLMIAAIGLGIGVCMTTLSIYYLMSSNPVRYKNDLLYSVMLDSWDPAKAFDEDAIAPNWLRDEGHAVLPPWELTYRDAMAIRQSDIPTRQVAMFKVTFIVQPEREDVHPFLARARATDGDFFALFDVPFLYGSAWDRSMDANAEQVAVINKETNDKVFGGENSVGREITLNERKFKVAGVIDEWHPTPVYYDVNNGAFDDSEEIFVPFTLTAPLELDSAGNTNCWKPETITSFTGFLNSECVWIQYWVQLDSADQRERYQAFLDNYVAEQKQLGRFGRPTNNVLLKVSDMLKIREAAGDDSPVLVGLSFMFLAVCVLNTVGLLLAKFIGKAPQIGLRRALGATRGAIFGQHLIEVGVVGLAGGLLGLALAWVGLRGVQTMLEESERYAHLDLNMLVVGLAIALVASFAAGLYPTWRVCRMSPAPFLKTQ